MIHSVEFKINNRGDIFHDLSLVKGRFDFDEYFVSVSNLNFNEIQFLIKLSKKSIILIFLKFWIENLSHPSFFLLIKDTIRTNAFPFKTNFLDYRFGQPI